MANAEQRNAAAKFAADWQGRGDEKQETQSFWLSLLQKIFGVDEPEKYISFERRVNPILITSKNGREKSACFQTLSKIVFSLLFR